MIIALSIYILSLLFLIGSYIRFHGVRNVSPISIFFVIYLMYVGPHAVYLLYYGGGMLPINLSGMERIRVLNCMSISNICFTALPFSFNIAKRSARRLRISGPSRGSEKRVFYVAIIYCFIFPIFITLIDSDNISRIIQTISAISGESRFTIQQVRRELFRDAISFVFIMRALYFLSGPAIIYISYCIFNKLEGRYISTIAFIASIFLFGLAFVTTHKQTWLYPFLGVLLALAIQTANRNHGRPRMMHAMLLLSPLLAIFALTIAYQVQYYSYNSNFFFWIDTAIFRLLGQIETTALAVRFYGEESGFLGLSGMGPLADLAGLLRRDPTSELPRYFLSNGANTSLQGGYLVSGWSVAGYAGVAVASLIAAAIVTVASASTYMLNSIHLRNVMQASVSLSLWTLTQMNLSTAMLTGGTVAIVGVVLALRSLEGMTKRKRVVFNNFPGPPAR